MAMRKGLVLFMIFSFLFSSASRAQSTQSVYDFKANLISGKEKSANSRTLQPDATLDLGEFTLFS